MRNLYWLNAAQMQWFLPYVRQSHRLLRADDRYILIHDHKLDVLKEHVVLEVQHERGDGAQEEDCGHSGTL